MCLSILVLDRFNCSERQADQVKHFQIDGVIRKLTQHFHLSSVMGWLTKIRFISHNKAKKDTSYFAAATAAAATATASDSRERQKGEVGLSLWLAVFSPGLIALVAWNKTHLITHTCALH